MEPRLYSNKREHLRHRLKLPIQFEFADQVWEVYSLNLSSGGMFVETDQTAPIQHSLHFLIWLGDRDDQATEVLSLKGTVVHLGDNIGMGIRFDRLDDNAEQVAKLEAFLQRFLEPTQPKPKEDR